MTGVLLAGAMVGLGLLLLVTSLQRPATRGAAAAGALAGLDRARRQLSTPEPAATSSRRPVLGRRLARALADAGVTLPGRLRADLALTGRPLENHLAASVTGALVGGLVALVVCAPLATSATGLPVSTPIWAGVLGAVVGGLLPSARVISRAGARRRDFQHVVGSFLDLVALNLSGGRGVPEALNSAAAVSDGWVMLRLRETLESARWRGVTQWTALGELGEQTGVPQLRDLAAALELVADDGAKVRESLTARAASLRRSELADAEGRAQARSQSMLVAQLLLAVGFLIFLIYPAITRVLTA
jgi:Flp pilus assembly protein TadB